LRASDAEGRASAIRQPASSVTLSRKRHSRFTALVKVRSKDTAAVVAALSRQIRGLPTSLRRSLTWDRGLGMAKHKTFTVDTNVKVYFCDPHSPWQRGTNENTNRLLRQYLPKRTDLSGYTRSQPDISNNADSVKLVLSFF
jgi:IS30 family transposase